MVPGCQDLSSCNRSLGGFKHKNIIILPAVRDLSFSLTKIHFFFFPFCFFPSVSFMGFLLFCDPFLVHSLLDA